MKNRIIQKNLAESEGTGITAESDGTGIHQLAMWKKMAAVLLLTMSFHSITWANTLIIFSEENQSYSGVLQTANETAQVVAIVNNETLIGLTDVSIEALSDGPGIADAVSDGSGFTDAVSDGSGFTDAVSDGSGFTDAVSDGSGFTDAVSDGSGFTDAVSDGSGFTDAVSDGSGLVFTLDHNDCKLMHIETHNEIISIRLDQVILNKQELNCG
ncbi:hypothetical protein [Marinicella rhabdoformis]|uniref:hypothetical protein n=1 Tax=Marinicella rhabdoformis TaxID=2580566 RepID=UPI0012AEDED9|nr:hypothetical protein [Marinicella rhabdoformis]